MTRAIWAGVLLAALGAAGCWELGGGDRPGKAPPPSAGSALPIRPPPPVMPDQVTEGNARQKTEALRAEILDAQQNGPIGAPAEGPGASRPTH